MACIFIVRTRDVLEGQSQVMSWLRLGYSFSNKKKMLWRVFVLKFSIDTRLKQTVPPSRQHKSHIMKFLKYHTLQLSKHHFLSSQVPLPGGKFIFNDKICIRHFVNITFLNKNLTQVAHKKTFTHREEPSHDVFFDLSNWWNQQITACRQAA